MEFILHIEPPTTTAQMHKVGVRNGRPYFYDPPEVKDAKQKLMAYLSEHVPGKPMDGPIALTVSWRYLAKGKHKHGEFRTSKPDTDNLQKLLKDCMTQLGFWNDDAQVVMEGIEKRWVKTGRGIYISVSPLEEQE